MRPRVTVASRGRRLTKAEKRAKMVPPAWLTPRTREQRRLLDVERFLDNYMLASMEQERMYSDMGT